MPRPTNEERIKKEYVILGKLRGVEKIVSGLYNIMLYDEDIQNADTMHAADLLSRSRQLLRVEILRSIQYIRKLKNPTRRKGTK
jgi:hypothetical protein